MTRPATVHPHHGEIDAVTLSCSERFARREWAAEAGRLALKAIASNRACRDLVVLAARHAIASREDATLVRDRRFGLLHATLEVSR